MLKKMRSSIIVPENVTVVDQNGCEASLTLTTDSSVACTSTDTNATTSPLQVSYREFNHSNDFYFLASVKSKFEKSGKCQYRKKFAKIIKKLINYLKKSENKIRKKFF